MKPKPEVEKPKITAVELAKKQRDISVAEFFAKNRHLLGFDNPTRALLTAVKEGVDNALDAAEEAGILPEVVIKIKELSEDRFKILVEDNGPGIVKEQIPRIFGKLLYGSKFHTLKMARGQQGIGISAAALYGQLTTGKPIMITSRTGQKNKAHYYEILIDTTKNEPVISKESDTKFERDHGTRVELELEARYIKGDKSVDEYIKQTSIANPHVKIHYQPPNGSGPVTYDRASKDLPEEPKAIKPHPYGVELGMLIKILQSSTAKNLKTCLQKEFSRVSEKIALEIISKSGLNPSAKAETLLPQDIEKLYRAISQVKIMSPPTDCISPIGEEQILKALKSAVKAEFYASITRPPEVYRGNPFLIEAGIAYLVEGYPPEEQAVLNRYANRVPLLYQEGACAITKAVEQVDWKNYGISQSKDALPTAPMLILVHMGSVWVPFTSEAKEAIAHYTEIIKEVKLALQECGRRLSVFVHKKQKAEYEAKRRAIFERYIEEVADSLDIIRKCGKEKIKNKLAQISKNVTKLEGFSNEEPNGRKDK